ncbi:hypothetical protein HDE71_004098 [Janthinobacterium sp. S3M3]|nr:hypothetical protein [Janthinobacterium sp. S3M3]
MTGNAFKPPAEAPISTNGSMQASLHTTMEEVLITSRYGQP